jgi:hypothetical protein
MLPSFNFTLYCKYESGQKNQRSLFLFSLFFFGVRISVSNGNNEKISISSLHIVLHLFMHSGWHNFVSIFQGFAPFGSCWLVLCFLI